MSTCLLCSKSIKHMSTYCVECVDMYKISKCPSCENGDISYECDDEYSCDTCGRIVCDDCIIYNNSSTYCKQCLNHGNKVV